MGLFGFFSPESSSSTTNISTSYQDAFNKTISTSDVMSEVGNTTLNLGDAAGGGNTLDKVLPIVAVAAIGLGLIALLKGRT